MNIDQFFALFLKELEIQLRLWHYYKFHTDPGSLEFRKAYFCQRLQYIADNITKKDSITCDIGCGYGSTALFLAFNCCKVHCTTLESYFKEIPARIAYWSQFGDVSGFTFGYEDLFDESKDKGECDYIIIQFTLHHLEPIDQVLQIICNLLRPDVQLVSVEENGNNVIQSLKLYKQRGNSLIIEFYD